MRAADDATLDSAMRTIGARSSAIWIETSGFAWLGISRPVLRESRGAKVACPVGRDVPPKAMRRSEARTKGPWPRRPSRRRTEFATPTSRSPIEATAVTTSNGQSGRERTVMIAICRGHGRTVTIVRNTGGLRTEPVHQAAGAYRLLARLPRNWRPYKSCSQRPRDSVRPSLDPDARAAGSTVLGPSRGMWQQAFP